ncbi:MAG TPA: hypothetical protein VD902_13635, partial [Symbiobacteriaceae bacterium]|nr:hypothetical protein [Symbiobacteriaceae bacterium]
MLLWISSSEVLNVTEPVELRLVWLKYQDQMVSSLSVGLVLICGLYVMSERENARREREAREQLLEAYACTMGALTSALDLRDSETWGH